MLFFKVSPILKQLSEKQLPDCLLPVLIPPTNAGQIIYPATAWVLFLPLTVLLETRQGILNILVCESEVSCET